MSMTQSLVQQQCMTLRSGMLGLGERVREALQRSLDALRNTDLPLAQAIVQGDREINRERRMLEQQALVVLAAFRPAGSDLRLVGGSLEMISEMERMGDYAADIARALLRLAPARLPSGPLQQCLELGEAAIAMFGSALDAYAEDADASGARLVGAADPAVDRAEQELIGAVLSWLRDHPEQARAGVTLLSIAHGYERVADRATNLAERIIYIATGETPDLDDASSVPAPSSAQA